MAKGKERSQINVSNVPKEMQRELSSIAEESGITRTELVRNYLRFGMRIHEELRGALNELRPLGLDVSLIISAEKYIKRCSRTFLYKRLT